MKKTQQILATIISLTILSFFVGTSWADVCERYYTIDDNDTSGDIAALSGCTSIHGSLTIENTALTSLSGLENLTSVASDTDRGLTISNNASLTSLTGLDSLPGASHLNISSNPALTNLCALSNLSWGYLSIIYNTVLSMETALALKTQLILNGYTGTFNIHDNDGSGLVTCDNDNDTIPDNEDNCPNTCNLNQLDADNDTIGDVCDVNPGCGGCGQPTCEESCELIDKVEKLLTHYYWNILGREPDSGGLTYWSDEVMRIESSGGDIKEGFISFAQTFFISQEYLDRGRDDEEFVTDLYNTFFDRPPDPGGLAYWLDRIANGATRNEVLDYFVHSPEFNAFMDNLFFGTS